MPNGKIQPENLKTFAEIGRWLKVFGKSIYGTRGGPISPQNWGVSTHNDKSIFIHILNWQADTLSIELATPIKYATNLRTSKPVNFKQFEGTITLENLQFESEEYVQVIELKLK
jgi:alpha-L-fucosidase